MLPAWQVRTPTWLSSLCKLSVDGEKIMDPAHHAISKALPKVLPHGVNWGEQRQWGGNECVHNLFENTII